MIDVHALVREIIAAVAKDAQLRGELRDALGPVLDEVPLFVSAATYASNRDIGESTVRRAIAEGRLAHERVGRSVRIPANAKITARGQVDTPKARAEHVWERVKRRGP